MLSKNFSVKELECQCGCGMIPERRAVDALQKARDIIGKPIKVTSGARCKKHNEAVGGAKESYHTKGLAFDIAVPSDRYRLELLRAIIAAGFSTIIFYPDRIHCDLRPYDEAFCKLNMK